MTTRRTAPAGPSGLFLIKLMFIGFITLGGVPLGDGAASLAQPTAPPSPPPAPSPEMTLQSGDSGPSVRHLQRNLELLGLYPGPVDGFYGSDTAEAVRSLQQQQGLGADGVAGTQTWLALDAALRQTGLGLPTPALGATTLAFTPLVVARPAPPPSALWLALMPLVPLVGGALTYLHRRLQHQQVFRRRGPRKQFPPKPRLPR